MDAVNAPRDRDDEVRPWKWAATGVASLIGSAIVMTFNGRWTGDVLARIALLLGGSVPLFAMAMLVAIFVRGWAGVAVGVGLVVVLVLLSIR